MQINIYWVPAPADSQTLSRVLDTSTRGKYCVTSDTLPYSLAHRNSNACWDPACLVLVYILSRKLHIPIMQIDSPDANYLEHLDSRQYHYWPYTAAIYWSIRLTDTRVWSVSSVLYQNAVHLISLRIWLANAARHSFFFRPTIFYNPHMARFLLLSNTW